jgi:hypothetical protein
VSRLLFAAVIFSAILIPWALLTIADGITRRYVAKQKARREAAVAELRHALIALQAAANGEPLTQWEIDHIAAEESQFLDVELWLETGGQP